MLRCEIAGVLYRVLWSFFITFRPLLCLARHQMHSAEKSADKLNSCSAPSRQGGIDALSERRSLAAANSKRYTPWGLPAAASCGNQDFVKTLPAERVSGECCVWSPDANEMEISRDITLILIKTHIYSDLKERNYRFLVGFAIALDFEWIYAMGSCQEVMYSDGSDINWCETLISTTTRDVINRQRPAHASRRLFKIINRRLLKDFHDVEDNQDESVLGFIGEWCGLWVFFGW